MSEQGQPSYSIAPWPNPWDRISEIAAKVGVGPCKPGHRPSITATGADGLEYDVWEVIAAALDKIDRAVTRE